MKAGGAFPSPYAHTRMLGLQVQKIYDVLKGAMSLMNLTRIVKEVMVKEGRTTRTSRVVKRTTTGKESLLCIPLLFLLFSLGMCGQPNCSSLANGLDLSASAATCFAQGSLHAVDFYPV